MIHIGNLKSIYMNCDIYSEEEFYKEEGWPTESFRYIFHINLL